MRQEDVSTLQLVGPAIDHVRLATTDEEANLDRTVMLVVIERCMGDRLVVPPQLQHPRHPRHIERQDQLRVMHPIGARHVRFRIAHPA
jgi:hypothetical protein